MKKLLIALLTFSLLMPTAFAATIFSDFSVNIDQREIKPLAPVKITSTSDGDITEEHGINILLSEQDQILWEDRNITVFGSAVDNGRINLNVDVEYSYDYKSVYIPVMDDFEAGEWFQITGFNLRAYNDKFGNRFLGLDTDGDLVANVIDVNSYKVTEDEVTDWSKPYPPRQIEYTLNDNGSVTLIWDNPPDYDLDGIFITRKILSSGQVRTFNVYTNSYSSTATFTDTDVPEEGEISYTLNAFDLVGNHGQETTIVVDLSAPAPEPEPEPSEPAEEPAEPESEIDELNRLLNYYKVRYAIKCMPSGIPVPENDSTCLWARIDLIYAQELTGNDDIDVSLTERDLDLMSRRRQYPEGRYQTNCVEASEPASYCSALGKALDRISYFLD